MDKPKCRHGTPQRAGSGPFNDECEQCRKEKEPYDQQTRSISATLPGRYRREEFDHLPEADHLAGTHDPVKERMYNVHPLSQGEKDMLEAGHGFIRSVVHAFGRTTTERRVSRRIHKVRWALEFVDWALTPAQLQALAMVYGCTMPPNKCAKRLGIPRQQFHDRLRRAEAIVDRLYDAKRKPISARTHGVLQYQLPTAIPATVINNPKHIRSNPTTKFSPLMIRLSLSVPHSPKNRQYRFEKASRNSSVATPTEHE